MKISSIIFLIFLTSCLKDEQDHSICAPKLTDSPTINLQHNEEIFKSNYEIRMNKAFIENDIFIGESHNLTADAVVIVGKTWAENTFYYKVAPDFPNKNRIYQAIEEWKNNLGDLVQFIETEDEENFVEFIVDEGCWSQVGMRGGRQEISLAKNCGVSQATHEIGHALGLWHEQSRSDRDTFVDIKWCNIPENKRHNFLKVDTNSMDMGSYDYKSLMHYGRYDFTMNKFPTIVSKTRSQVQIFSSNKPSEGDVLGLRCLYGDLASCD
jgi:hypothetical protein